MSDVVFSSVDGDLVLVRFGSEYQDVRDHWLSLALI